MAKATFEEWYSIYKPVYENNYAAWLRDTGFADFADPKELAEQAAHEDYDNANGDETRITIRPEGWDPDGKLFDEFSKNFTFEQWYLKTKRSYLNSVQKFLDGKEYEYTGIFELVGTTAEEQAEEMALNDFESKEFNATSPFNFDQTTGFFEHHKAEFAKRAVEMLKKTHSDKVNPETEFDAEMLEDDKDVMALLTGHVSIDEFISNNYELRDTMLDMISDQCAAGNIDDILNQAGEIWMMAIGETSAVAYEIMSHYKPDAISQLAHETILWEQEEIDPDELDTLETTQNLVMTVYDQFNEEALGPNWRDYINFDQAVADVRPLIMKPDAVYRATSDAMQDTYGYNLEELGINKLPQELTELFWERIVEDLKDSDTPGFFIETPDGVAACTFGYDSIDIEEWLYDELGNRTAEMFEEFNQRYEYEYEGESATLDDLIRDCYLRRLPIDDLAGLVAGTISPDEYLEDLGYQKVD